MAASPADELPSPVTHPVAVAGATAKGVTLEEIIGGMRCSPLTLKEWEGFLLHEEHSVENLQFTIWYRDYRRRFEALPAEYQALSSPPEPYRALFTSAGSMRTSSVHSNDSTRSWWTRMTRKASVWSNASAKGEEKLSAGEEKEMTVGVGGDDDPYAGVHALGSPRAPSVTPTTATRKTQTLRFANAAGALFSPLTHMSSHKKLPADTPLPFLEEIKLITTTFILPGAAKELNIDARLRKHMMKCLRPDGSDEPISTHPDIFKDAAEHAWKLMEQSLPRYLVWARGNINWGKRLFSTGIGLLEIALGLMLTLIVLYYEHSRWARIAPVPLFYMGVVQFYSAQKFFCTQVARKQARQLYPWELSALEASSSDNLLNPTANVFGSSTAAAADDKGLSDLQASLPFLFEPEGRVTEVPLVHAGDSKEVKTKKQRIRSKFVASWRTPTGKKTPMKGPERVIEDEWIRNEHKKQRNEIYIVAVVSTAIWLAIFLAIPERKPL
ncbi:hypothetical protein JCM10213_005484 [Rhodosporidiobolus nylandii]